MSDRVVTLELRWFFEGAIPDDVRRWFDAVLPGPTVEPARRSDFYLIVPGRDDINLKLRERRLELKWRSRSAPFVSDRVTARGTTELWEKWSWSYAREADVEAGFADGVRGPRVDVGKVRWQRNYEVNRSGELHPMASQDPADRSLAIEVTELAVRGQQAWTLAFDAIGPAPDAILAHAVERLLEAVPKAPRLANNRSFGYPRWLMRETENA